MNAYSDSGSTLPYHGYLTNLVIAASGRSDAHFNPFWDDGHIKFFSVTSLERILRESGFIEIAIGGIGTVPFLWKSMVAVARKK
jgi:2-polyprenyl-6-hydroxyphenyl methylase/3-demethylubiquinone-9 3-methyltransferase